MNSFNTFPTIRPHQHIPSALPPLAATPLHIVMCWGSKASGMLQSQGLWVAPSMPCEREREFILEFVAFCSEITWFRPPFCVLY